jgi:hypothetical protein
MAPIPPSAPQEIINRIYAAYEAREGKEIYLGRLGASFVGEECPRKTWLSWRAYAKAAFSGRMLRLFGTGHWQEDRIVKDLRDAGLEVWSHDETGAQFEYTDKTGHFIVKLDGVVKGVPGCVEKPHVLEIKTHNKNSFSGVQKHGVLKSKPEHYSQMQAGMWLSGQTRALYVAVCKDDEQFYIERVKEDKAEQKRIEQKVIKLVEARMRPAGISEDGESFGCKYCDMKAACLRQVDPLRTCRSCVNCEPIDEGDWACNLTGVVLSKDEQRKACNSYEVL